MARRKNCAIYLLSIMFGYGHRLANAKSYCVASRGHFYCNGRPATDVTVELYDDDYVSKDDLLATNHTNANGTFYIHAQFDNPFGIEPYLQIYTRCGAPPDKARTFFISFPSELGGRRPWFFFLGWREVNAGRHTGDQFIALEDVRAKFS